MHKSKTAIFFFALVGNVSVGAETTFWFNTDLKTVLTSYAALMSHAVQRGANVMISRNANGTLALRNATLATLSANRSGFQFV
jgi:hypothetical protein